MAKVARLRCMPPCPPERRFIGKGAQQAEVALRRIVDSRQDSMDNLALETRLQLPSRFAVLIKVAGALQVPVEELIAAPRAVVELYKAAMLTSTVRGKVRIRKLLPDTISGFEIDRMELAAGAYMAGIPHTPGTREYLTCESGQVQLSVAGETWVLEPGDVVVFRGDQKHGYRNPGTQTAIAHSVIALAPVTG